LRYKELRTTFNIAASPDKITYIDHVMFIGSCFASSIGTKMEIGRMPVMINPAGTVFNPVSVCNTLDTIINGREYVEGDLYCHDGTYISFNHYTDFSSEDPAEVLDKINRKSKEALIHLSKSRFLFITFGTARVFRWKKTGQIVSNCHKIPADQFETSILTAEEIVKLWTLQLDNLKSIFPGLKVVFTISPVRHWKDGAHGNQVSKSVLFVAVEELLNHPASPGYFPAYELVNDDLRDYRFYADDMLHLSETAITYVWETFSDCYIDSSALNIRDEIVKITKACNHRLDSGSEKNIRKFAENMLNLISRAESKVPSIDFTAERNYFLGLAKR
jgi:hypothetical protein